MKRFLLFLFLAVVYCGYAMAYDFSAVCESGQTLYYNITSSTEPYAVKVTSQNTSSPYYSTYPTGNLTIPSSVTYSGRTYSVTSIGGYAFYGCTGLTSVTIPNSVTSIGIGAFFGCSGLTSVTIPSSVTSIGNQAFYHCSGMTSVYYAGDVASWCGISFEGYYSNPLYYAHNLYVNNSLVTDLVIPNTVTEIGQYAFHKATCLTSVTISSSVTSIGDCAFSGCSELSGDLNIPNSITTIGRNSFSSCSNLSSLTIGNSVSNISVGAFNYCSGLESIVVDSDNAIYDSRDNSNAIIHSSTNTLVSGCKNTVIPNSVVGIGENAFYYCTGLDSITIPNSVEIIYNSAFYGCSGLASVTIPNSVTSIGESAFQYCSGLRSVIIPNSVTRIENLTFYNCSNLTSITIPSSITGIGNSVFHYCSLRNIYANPTTPPSASAEICTDYGYNATLWVPCGSAEAYRTADIWSNFSNIREMLGYTLNVSSSNSQHGTTSVTYPTTCADNAIISATPANHYHFVQWNDGNTDNPRTITEHTNANYTAIFAIDQHIITVVSENPAMGIVLGGGSYDYGTEIQITATANEGFRFLSWSDNSTENPHYITVTEDAMYIATFEVDNSQQPIYVTINATACGSYTWNDSTYTQIGEYQQTFTASTSVDSIVTLVLEIFPLPEPEITATGILDACNPSSVMLSTGNYSAYNWNTGESTETISVTEPGNYYVEVVDGHDCHGYSEMLEVGYSNTLTEAPRLKRVGMSNTGTNIVQWTVANTEGIAGFEIYREDNIANVYTLIQRIDRPGVRSCTDVTANPSARAYRYKICAVDECGGLSPLSEPHKTMHLTINRGIGNTWNLIWSPYEGMEFASYKIYRGTTVQNMVVIGEVPSTMNTFTDSDNPNSTGFFYKVVTVANTRSDDDDEMLLGSNIVDNGMLPEYTITAVSANPNQGTVVGGGTYPEGSLVTLAAIPTDGYEFLSWSDESTENPHYITVTGDAVYVATFVPSTDIKDNALPEIALFPNPATDILNITSSETISEIEIVNVMGQIVKRMEVNSDTALCDVEDLKAGVYIVKISTASATLSIQKFAKE